MNDMRGVDRLRGKDSSGDSETKVSVSPDGKKRYISNRGPGLLYISLDVYIPESRSWESLVSVFRHTDETELPSLNFIAVTEPNSAFPKAFVEYGSDGNKLDKGRSAFQPHETAPAQQMLRASGFPLATSLPDHIDYARFVQALRTNSENKIFDLPPLE